MSGAVAVELKAITGEFIAKMKEAGEEVEHLSTKGASGFNKMASVGKAAFLGLAGAGTAVAGMSLELADTFEKSHARLEASLTAAGSSFEELKPQIEATNKAMENLGFTNAQTEEGLSHLVVATQDPAKAMKDMSLAADVARARNIDLSTATDLVAKAMSGNLRPLKQMGIDLPITASSALKLETAHTNLEKAQQKVNDVLKQFPDAANAASKGHKQYEAAIDKVSTAQAKLKDLQGSSDAIMKALAERMSGQAKAAAETFAGKVEVLKTKAEDLGAKIGLALIPILDTLAGTVENVVNWFEKHKTTAEVLAGVIGGVLVVSIGAWIVELTTATAESVVAFGTFLAAGVSAATGFIIAWAPILVPIGLVVAAIAAVGVAIYELVDHWSTVWGAIKTVGLDAWHVLRDDVLKPIVGAFDAVGGALSSAWSSVERFFSTMWDGIKTAWNDVKTWLGQAWSGEIQFFTSLPGKMAHVFDGMWDGIKDAFRSAINFIIDGWNSLHFTMPGINTHIPGVGKIGGFDVGLPQIPRLNTGVTDFAGGLAYVHAGELLVNMPKGSNVIPAAQVARGAGGMTLNQTNNYYGTNVTGNDVARDTAWRLRVGALAT